MSNWSFCSCRTTAKQPDAAELFGIGHLFQLEWGDQNRPHPLSAETNRSGTSTAQLPQEHRHGVGPLCSPSLLGCFQRGSSTKAQWPSAPLSPRSNSCSTSPAAHVCSGLSTKAQDSTAVIHTPAAWTRSIIHAQDLMPIVLRGTSASDTGWPQCLQCQLESSACLSGTTAFDMLMQLQCSLGALTWASALAHAG